MSFSQARASVDASRSLASLAQARVPPPRRWRRHATTWAFLAPALLMLAVWLVYPTLRTIVRSFFGRDGSEFVGLDNYRALLTTPSLATAIRNNAIWVAVVPALVTAIGMVFAVLTERIRWVVAFRTAVFMPLAISMFAAGVIWHIMDDKDPQRGAVNALVGVAHDAFASRGVLTRAEASTAALHGSPARGFALREAVAPGGSVALGLTAIPPGDLPSDARQATLPAARRGAVSGTVFRDFRPGGGRPGVVERGELGIPGASVELRKASGAVVAKTRAGADGGFRFDGLNAGSYGVTIAARTFDAPVGGVAWLGPKLVTPAIMIAYIWVWAGFAMVLIAAGLAALPRDVLEAARIDGATEWQVFRRITAPLLAPVLSVVFITMVINVLKIFDIILAVAPGSTQDDASVIALAMWRTSFGGVNDFGLGSAIAVLLLALVVPALAFNLRRFKREGGP